MMDEDVRWRQRFENFETMFLQWCEALDSPRFDTYSDLEKQGVIQRFELMVELAWKVVKDYLENQNVPLNPPTPRTTIEAALAYGLIEDEEIWRSMLKSRNIFSHAYDPAQYDEAVHIFKNIYRAPMEALYARLKAL